MTTWKDSLQRRDEVKAAFEEGAESGAWDADHAELSDADKERLWQESDARKRLEKPLD